MANRILYRGLFAVVAIFALGAVLVGTVGLVTVLTGGTDTGPSVSILGAYSCESFDGDPEMPHESEIGEPFTVVGDSQLASFNTTTGDDLRIEIETVGALINASASRSDGTVLPVERFPEENRLVLTVSQRAPFRLFIDTLDEEGSAVRTELDICPPESSIRR